MINIYYNQSYFNRKRIFLTKQLKYSKLVKPYLNFCYKFNIPVNSNLIFSGPQKRINHLLKLPKNNNFVYNKHVYNNSYLVQFDNFGKDTLTRILKINNKQKIIVGPLMDLESTKKLIELTNKHNNLKILVASQYGYTNLVHEMNLDIKPQNVLVAPSGIESDKNISSTHNQRNDTALIYFKKRNEYELDFVKNFFDKNLIKYKLIRHGSYKDSELKKYALSCKFGVLLCGTESQGFAVQEMMLQNLPLFVWNKKINIYGDYKLSGSSVSSWNDDMCGVIVNNEFEFENKFYNFYKTLDSYSPNEFVRDNLTYEIFSKRLINLFNSF